MNIRELVAAMAMAILLALAFLPACTPLERYRETQRKAGCQNNLRRIAQALQMYTAEYNGSYPPLQRRTGPECGHSNRGVLMLDGPSLFPAYIEDYRVLLCPGDPKAAEVKRKHAWQVGAVAEPCLFDDTSYVYLGWAVKPRGSQEDVEDYLSRLYAEGMRHLFGAGAAPSVEEDFAFLGPGGRRHRMFRLHTGIPKQFGITRENGLPLTPAERIPVLFDRFETFAGVAYFNHMPGGSNVLFLDGHVQFVKYKAMYPCTHNMGVYLAEGPPPPKPLDPEPPHAMNR